MPSCICIDANVKVVFVLSNFDDRIQISTLKIALENKFSIFLDGRIHAFENACIFGFKVGMEFSKICGHMLKVGVDGALVLEGIGPLHFLVHFEAIGEAMAWIGEGIPK